MMKVIYFNCSLNRLKIDQRCFMKSSKEKEGKSYPGCIFSVHAALSSCDDEFVGIGYDGQVGVNYNELKLGIISEFVAKKISNQGRDFILSFWGKIGAGPLSTMGIDVENLFWEDLKANRPMRQYDMNNKSACTVFQCRGSGPMLFGEDKNFSDLPQVVFNANNTICRMKQNHALIDFAGPGHRVYQVTVGKKHKLTVSGLKGLFLASGHIVENNGTIVKSRNIHSRGIIQFCWVISEGKENEWKKKLSTTISPGNEKEVSSNEEEDLKKIQMLLILKDVLKEYVTQYVLIMDIDEKKVNELIENDVQGKAKNDIRTQMKDITMAYIHKMSIDEILTLKVTELISILTKIDKKIKVYKMKKEQLQKIVIDHLFSIKPK